MGQLLTIEGTDGSGKATQTALLTEALRGQGLRVATFEFPQYTNDSSLLVRQYLAGEFGAAHEVPAKVASAFFAFDRFMAAPLIREQLATNDVVILDRYVAANKGHQLGKLRLASERREFLDWLNKLEYETNGIPVPDLTILLYLPVAAVSQRDSSGQKGGVAHDIHESDHQHLEQAEAAYLWVAAHDTVENWRVVPCLNEAGERLSPAALHQQLRQAIVRETHLVLGQS